MADFERFGVGVKAGVSGDDSWITFKALQLLFLFFFILVLFWNIPFLEKVNLFPSIIFFCILTDWLALADWQLYENYS